MLLFSTTGVSSQPESEYFDIYPEFAFQLGSDGWDYLTSNELSNDNAILLSGNILYPVYETGITGPSSGYQGPFYDLNPNEFTEYPVVGEGNTKNYGGFGEIPLTKLYQNGTIAFSKYVGGDGEDAANGMYEDENGNIYLFGESASEAFTVPSINITNNGGYDAFIMKFDPHGSFLDYASFGGQGVDRIVDIVVGNNDSIYMIGSSNSPDFPLINAVDSSLGSNNESDVIIIQLDNSLTPVYSSFFGGNLTEIPIGIEKDDDGNIYIAGTTFSEDFPLYDPISINTGESDVFLVKFDQNMNLSRSTLLGGGQKDTLRDFIIHENRILGVGYTFSTDFPILQTSETLDRYMNEDGTNTVASDGFYFSTNMDLELTMGSYLGGSKFEFLESIVPDDDGNYYIGGMTSSADYPIHGNFPQPPPFNRQFLQEASEGIENRDLLITKISPAGKVMYSIFYGGYLNDYISEISHFSDSGKDYVIFSGYTDSADLPITKVLEGGKRLTNSFIIKFHIPQGSFNQVAYPGKDNSSRNTFLMAVIGLLSVVGIIVIIFNFIKKRSMAEKHENYMDRYDLVREAMKEE